VLAIILALALGGYLARDVLFFAFAYSGSEADWELMEIRNQIAHGEVDDPDEAVRARCLEIARANPGSRAELAAYLFVSKQWPATEDDDVAFKALSDAAKTADIGDWEQSLMEVRPNDRRDSMERWRPLAASLIERVQQQPDHPKAARLLCEAAVLVHPDTDLVSAPPELLQVASLIEANYATSPDLANFCEVAGNLGNSVNWSQPFEPHVRRILEVNQDRFVQCSAHFALASIVRSGGASRQDEARQLYEDFLAKFDGEMKHPAQSIEQKNRQSAQRELDVIRTHGIGMAAPETRGVDLDGNALSLEDYRGRVVLVSFWATWCRPCLQAVPLERALLESFGEADFANFGINADDDLEAAKEVARIHGIAWPSLQKSSHSKNWNIGGYPTFYLLDRNGTVADRWLGVPSDAELNDAVRGLIDSKYEPAPAPTGPIE
jgi:thiol-disulfide isomerase/thioredoxin